MKSVLRGICLLLLVTLVGCAAQPMKVDSSFWDRKGQKIGLVIAELPKPTTHKAGAQGLLDIAINNAMAGTLDTYLAAVDISGVNAVLTTLEDGLRKRGQIPVRLNSIKADQLVDFKAPEGAGRYGAKDLRSLSGNEPVDAVLLVNVTAAGTIRSYYGFIPTSAPSGYLTTDNVMVNAKDNILIWSALVSSTPPVQGEWDQPPTYANIDSAIKNAVTQLSSNISKTLFESP